MNQYFRYLLVLIFFAAITIIVFLQFNSNKNIDRLINGNEDLLESQGIKTELQQLQKNVFAIDAETRTIVIKGEKNNQRFQQLSEETEIIRNTQTHLHTLESEPEIAGWVIKLKDLIDRKLLYNEHLLDTFKMKGKIDAEKMINNLGGTRLSDSISVLATKIDHLHEQYATRIINDADNNGKKAKVYGSILAVLAIVASMLMFSYVSFKMMDQKKMIAKLNNSEQKARESAIIKEHFLANMSHEIRTPLNAILGFTGLLKRKKMDEETGKYVDFIHIAGENLLNIVNDVLDLSKIEAGMVHIESSAFNFRETIENLITIYREKALEKNLEFITHINASVPEFLNGDALRLSQILTNLIGNSIKFTTSGQITVDCSAVEQNDKKLNLRITVEDTGIGINNAQLGDIFERFHQSDETISRKYGGTGLGLAIVRDLVKLMGGQISVKSTEHIGTSIILQLPFAIADAIDLDKNIKWIDEESVFDSDETVLITEDNEINQSLMAYLLSSWKLKYDIVGDGKNAILKLKNKNYALVLMDIQMPGMDGYMTTDYIRKDIQATMPIIAMTAHAMPGEKEKCIEHGMDDYISKPIDANKLKTLLAKYLPIKKPAHPKNAPAKRNNLTNRFRFINTNYLESISLGNREYEKAVTEQFIEIIPAELKEMQQYWVNGNIIRVKEIAHSLKTTVSILGILPLIEKHLDEIEHNELTMSQFETNKTSLDLVCKEAIQEAKSLLNQLSAV